MNTFRKCVIVIMLLKFVFMDALMIVPLHQAKAQSNVTCSNDLNDCLRVSTPAELLLTGSVIAFSGGTSVGAWTFLGPLLGLGPIASLLSLSFLNPQPSFEKRLKADLSELKAKELPNINKNQCKNNGLVADILNDLPESLSTIQSVVAAKKVFDIANMSENKLDDIKEALSKNGRFDTLNTQGANVTIRTANNGLQIESGGNKEDQYKKAFYLPKLVKGAKDVLRQSASLRAHTGVSLLFNGGSIEGLLTSPASVVADIMSDTKNALVRGYKIIQRNNDIPSVLVSAFLDGEFKDEYALNSISDFIYEDAERIELISYVQRLLQDLGVHDSVSGEFTPDQLALLERVTPSMTSNATPEDLLYVKNLAYKMRNVFVGLATGDFVTNTDREDGHHSLIGAIVGNFAKGSAITYRNILDMYVEGKSDSEVIDEIIRLGMKRQLFDAKSNKILDLIVDEVSVLLPGERRKDFIANALKIVLSLKKYAVRTRNKTSEKELEAAEIVLLAYEKLDSILKNKEDYFGILFNSRRAKLNTVKRANKKKATTANNNAIAKIDVVGPRKALKDVLKRQRIDKSDRVMVAVYAAIGTARGFIRGLKEMENLEPTAAKPRLSTEKKAKKMVVALNKVNVAANSGSKFVKRAIKNLKFVARVQRAVSNGELEYYLAIDEIPVFPDTPPLLKLYITEELKPKKANNQGRSLRKKKGKKGKKGNKGKAKKKKYPGLKILIDRDQAQRRVSFGRFASSRNITYRQLIIEYFRNNKKKTYLVDGIRAKIHGVTGTSWLVEVDNGNVFPDDDGSVVTFKKHEHEFNRRKVTRRSVDKLDAGDYITLVRNNVVEEVGQDQSNVFSLHAVKCASSGNDLQSNKFMSAVSIDDLQLIPLSSSTSILDGFDLKGKVTLDKNYSEIGAEVILKDSETGKTIYQQGVPLQASAVALTAGSVVDFVGPEINLNAVVEAVRRFAIEKGISTAAAAKRITPLLRLVGKVVIAGSGITVTSFIAVVALDVIAEKIKLEALLEESPDPENKPVVIPVTEPFVQCVVIPNIVMSGESANIHYYSAGAEYVAVQAKPYYSSSFLPTIGQVTIMPQMDTNVMVAARNGLGQLVETMCAVQVRDEETAQIIGRVDEQFIYGTDGVSRKSWGYPVLFNVEGEEREISSFTFDTPPITVIPKFHMSVLKVDNKDTIENDFLVNAKELKYVDHKGGVFRHYGTGGVDGKIQFIVSNNIFPISGFGDLYLEAPPNGKGVYFTDINIEPSSELKRKYIAKRIRLLDVENLDELRSIPIGDEPENKLLSNRKAYIDVIFNYAQLMNKKGLHELINSSIIKHQFLSPTQYGIDGNIIHKINIKDYD